jgi:putative ABC transport system permease protein
LGKEVSTAFEQGCLRSLELNGFSGLLGYAGRGYLDVVREGLAERRATRGAGPKRSLWSNRAPMDLLFLDLRVSVRTLRRKPVFTGVALLILALGIGSTTAIFSVVNGVLLKPFPYPDAAKLVVLWNTNPERGQDEFRMAAPDFFELQRSTSSFSSMALAAGATSSLPGDDLPPIQVEGSLVSADFFEVLGIDPLMGRTFRAEENQGDHRVVILSYAFWAGRFGGDPEIIGRRIEMDGILVEVVGVMPRMSIPIGGSGLDLPGPDALLFWRPLDFSLDWVSEIGAHVMAVIARVESEVSIFQAREEVTAVAAGLVEEGRAPAGEGILVRSFKDHVVGDVRQNLLVLLAAAGLLLLMACGNVANLLLARAKEREREVSVRSALGAGRGRLVKQILTETILLSVGGGLLGLGLAGWGSGALVQLLPSDLPRQSEIGVDGAVLFFTMATAVLTSFLAILIPTVRLTGRSALRGLKEGGRGETPGRGRNRANRTIVVGQIALATVLLFGAGLLFRSLQSLGTVDPGFRREGVLTAQLMLPDSRYGERGEVLSFYDQLKDRVRGLPGVSSVAFGMNHPMENSWWNGIALLDRPDPDPEQYPTAIFRPVSDGYFSTMGIPILEGRTFESGDRFESHPVMVVNQEFVDRHFQGESPLGERVEFVVGRFIWGEEAPTVFEVVGVAGDVRFNGLRDPSEPAFHIPLHQFPYQAVKLMVQGSGDLQSLAGLVRAEIWALDPDLPVTEVRTMDQVFSGAVAQDRFNVILLEVFALTALVLAAAGIYGVLSYTVSQRKAELGIRMALGAPAGSVLGMVVWDALTMGGWGFLLGITSAMFLGRFLRSLLFQVPILDVLVLAGVCSVLAAVAVGSGLLPAFRAARTNLMVALRPE